MSTDEQFEAPTIVGTQGEALSVLLSSHDPNYTDVDVRLAIPHTLPTFHQQLETSTYRLPEIHQLSALLDGNSAVSFEFDALNFCFKVYEHSWGARYAFIAEGAIT